MNLHNQLSNVKQLHEKTTQGTWKAREFDICLRLNRRQKVLLDIDESTFPQEQDKANLQFTAAAHNLDWSALLAVVERVKTLGNAMLFLIREDFIDPNELLLDDDKECSEVGGLLTALTMPKPEVPKC